MDTPHHYGTPTFSKKYTATIKDVLRPVMLEIVDALIRNADMQVAKKAFEQSRADGSTNIIALKAAKDAANIEYVTEAELEAFVHKSREQVIEEVFAKHWPAPDAEITMDTVRRLTDIQRDAVHYLGYDLVSKDKRNELMERESVTGEARGWLSIDYTWGDNFAQNYDS